MLVPMTKLYWVSAEPPFHGSIKKIRRALHIFPISEEYWTKSTPFSGTGQFIIPYCQANLEMCLSKFYLRSAISINKPGAICFGHRQVMGPSLHEMQGKEPGLKSCFSSWQRTGLLYIPVLIFRSSEGGSFGRAIGSGSRACGE
jgi:hypothetical protein